MQLRSVLVLLAAASAGSGCVGNIAMNGDIGGAPAADMQRVGEGGPGSAGGLTPVPGSTAGNGGGPAASGAIDPASCAAAPVRIWKLTPDQINRTVAQVVPGGSVPVQALAATLTTTAGFFSNAAQWRDMSPPHFEQLMGTMSGLASGAVTKPEALAACATKKPISSACAREIITGVGARAFRRPLGADEVNTYGQFFDAETAANGADVGLRQVLRAILLSPNFLYRTEIGDPAATGKTVPLTHFERAQAISYFVTDGPPDAALYDAAVRGALGTRDQIQAQVQRLMMTPQSARGLFKYLTEQYHYDGVVGVEKDPKKFPRWTADAAADMVLETRAFLENVLWSDDARLSTLLTAGYSFLDERLATLYGIAGFTGTQLRKVAMPAGRSGMLMQGSFLAAHAKKDVTDIVRRGRSIREQVMCLPTPDPPPNVPPIPADDGKSLGRDRIAMHVAQPACSGCHSQFDPMGYGLENFDATGAWRTQEGGKPIDPSGNVPTRADRKVFATGTEMAQVLAAAPETQECTVRRLFSYANGREPTAQDACALADLGARFSASGGDIRRLVVDLVSSDAFVVRSK